MEEVAKIEKGFSVRVENVTKKFFRAKNNIINGLSMRVPEGSMYGLLGPSGCGKSTLLKCILGKLDIDSGIIQISATKWKHIGYMPQEISLHENLLIEELFLYYKIIYGMSTYTFYEKIKKLSQLFELPPLDRLVGGCSGGQKRRISLAVTLLHDPDILILDEPTVGLDPLLAHNIMNYLKCLSAEKNKTILVTTHYMEEARSLNFVGLMRHGVLLAEDEPEVLISRYSCESLDDVFVHVIIQSNSSEAIEDVEVKSEEKINKCRPCLGKDEAFSYNNLFALLYKDYKYAIRSLSVTLLTLLLPLYTMVLFIIVMAKLDTPNGIGYYNEELIGGDTCSRNDSVIADECPPSRFYSCDFLTIMDKKLVIKKYDSLEEGLESLKKADIYAMLHFPNNFSTSIVNRLSFRINDMESTEDLQINAWFDNSMYFSSIKTKKDLYDTLLGLVEQKCRECGIDTRLARSLSSVKLNLVFGSYEDHLNSYIPGVLIGVLVYSSYYYTAALLLMQKQCGVLERDQMNGITSVEILTSTLLNQFIVINIHTTTSLLGIHWYYGYEMLGSYALAYVCLLLGNTFASLFGILAVLISANSLFVGMNGANLYFMTVFVNGAMWPIEGVYWILRDAVKLIPSVTLTMIYKQVYQHGFGLFHHLVYPGFAYLILTNFFLGLLIYMKIRFNNYQL